MRFASQVTIGLVGLFTKLLVGNESGNVSRLVIFLIALFCKSRKY
jgi:hypothetical protein